MHILLPVTDTCSSWISGRGRMAIEMFSWPSLHERMCRTWGSNSGPLACQVNLLPIELPRPVSDLLSSPAVPGKCQACGLMQIYPRRIYYYTIIKSGAMTLSRSPQCRALSRAVIDEKSLSLLFPVGGGQWLQIRPVARHDSSSEITLFLSEAF